jgi:hypothetical protein
MTAIVDFMVNLRPQGQPPAESSAESSLDAAPKRAKP